MDAARGARDNGPILNHLQQTLTSPEPLEALRALTALRAELDAFEREQVRRALESGDSYTTVARGLGISRQAAHRRYRGLIAAPPPRITAEVRDALRRAAAEAARRGSPTVEGEHVVHALTATGPPPSEPRTVRLGEPLRAALARVASPIQLGDLLRAAAEEPAARRLLEQHCASRRSRAASPGTRPPERPAAEPAAGA